MLFKHITSCVSVKGSFLPCALDHGLVMALDGWVVLEADKQE